MNYFISGGCKNGKSMHAQRIAKNMSETLNVPLYYVATMIPGDDEDRARIKRHISERDGWGFRTLEQGRNICEALDESVDCNGVFLIDSVTALLSNEMFADGNFDCFAPTKVAADLLDFADKTGNAVFVSDYIYSDARCFDKYTDFYRAGLAYIDKKLAKKCDSVIEVTFGHKIYYKNGEE